MPTQHGWQKLLAQAKSMMGQAGLLAYDRAKLLSRVFTDQKFRDAHPEEDDFQLADRMSEYCGDLAIKFLRLKQLVEHFPKREQWADGNLERMLAQMLAERQAADDESKQPATQQRIKRADFDKLADEKKHVEARLKHEVEMRETAEQKIQRLEAENAELRHKLAVTEGRLTELERIMDREAVAA